MAARLHPGVYVEEVPSGARSIEAAGTSTAIFVGETERGPLTPTRIKSRSEYERAFGGYLRDAAGGADPVRLPLTYAMDAFFQNGGRDAYILRAIAPSPGTASRLMPGHASEGVKASSPGSWGNRLFAIFATSTDGDPTRFRVVVVLTVLQTGQKVIVEDFDRLSKSSTDENYVVDVLKRSLYIRWTTETVDAALPTPYDTTGLGNRPTETQLLAEADSATDLGSGSGGDSALASTGYPTLLAQLDEVTDAALFVLPGLLGDFYAKALAYVEARPMRDLFYIADLPQKSNLDTTTAASQLLSDYAALSKSDFVAVYWPWIQVADPVGVGRDPAIYVAPSGFMAGLYARTDARRGVWKAPAGVDATLLGIRKLEYKVLDAHQDDLNPKGINALRLHPVGGAVIWGARTTRPDTEWRYVPVRRTAMFLRKSIFDGIQWAVFEPNDFPLWASLRLTIGAFMEQQFRQGAFAGRTSRDAYFVKCDAETTTEADKAAGIVNVWVGFAPLRPAEFVVVRLSQKVDQQA